MKRSLHAYLDASANPEVRLQLHRAKSHGAKDRWLDDNPPGFYDDPAIRLRIEQYFLFSMSQVGMPG